MSNPCAEAQTPIIINGQTNCFASPKLCESKYPQYGSTSVWTTSSSGMCVLSPSNSPVAEIIRNGTSSSPCTTGQVYICSSASPLTGAASCLCAPSSSNTTTTTSFTDRASSKSASCDSALACFFTDSLPLFLSASAVIVFTVVVIVFCIKRICCPSVKLCPSRKTCTDMICMCCCCNLFRSKPSETNSAFTTTVSTLSSSSLPQSFVMSDTDTKDLASILSILRSQGVNRIKNPSQLSSNPSSASTTSQNRIKELAVPALDLQLHTWRKNPLHPTAFLRRLDIAQSQISEKSTLDIELRTLGLSLHNTRRLSLSSLSPLELLNIEQATSIATRIALSLITAAEQEKTQARIKEAKNDCECSSPQSVQVIDTPRFLTGHES